MSTPAEIAIQMMTALSAAELCTVMKAGADLLTKIIKSSEGKISRATGSVPPQLAKNKEWVAFVLEHAAANGWDTFEAKNGDEIVVMEASVETPEGHRFEDGSQITMKHAMSLAKHLKNSESELWKAFSAEYDARTMEVKSATTTPVRRTRAEIALAAAERKMLLAAERETKARIREEEKAERAAKKAEAAAAKAAAKEEKAAEKDAEMVMKPAPAVAEPMATHAPVAAATAAKKSLAQTWRPPTGDLFKAFPYKGKVYMANNQYHVFERAAQGELGAWIGQYILAEDRIDDSVEEPLYD